MPPRPTSRQAVPWRIYLLIDPSTKPTNHPLGTIFYVGLRSELPEPVDLREAAEPESIPEEETAARMRLARLNQEGVRVLVEVVPEQNWVNAETASLARTVGALCATLHPSPLNERLKSIRWPGSLAQTVETARLVPLPEGGAILRTHKGPTPVAELPLGDPEALFTEAVAVVDGHSAPRAIGNRLREGGPLPLVLMAEGRTGRGVLPGGFVLGVWMVESVVPVNEERTQWRVTRYDDPQTEGALRRRFLHQLVDPTDFNGLKLRKA